MTRIVRLAIAAFAFSLIASGAWAGDSSPAKEQGAAAVVAADEAKATSANVERRRLTTAERWRGRPYLRSAENELLRSHALDKRLPPSQAPFTSGVAVNTAGSELQLPREALDRRLPVVPSFSSTF